jgi:acyl carrier protein
MSALSLQNRSALTLSLSQARRISRADLLDRFELMLAIEAKFAGVEITDDDIGQIQVAGDVIRHLNATKQVKP